MREYATPMASSAVDDRLPHRRRRRQRPRPPRPARAGQEDRPDGGSTARRRSSSREVRAVAKGLVASGVQAGDRVALLSRTRYEWTLMDYGIWFAGAVSVPVYESASVEQLEWLSPTPEPPLPWSRPPATSTGCGRLTGSSAMCGASMTGLWPRSPRQVPRSPTTTWRHGGPSLTPSSLATIIYTSGTTGQPRGCMLTHGNFMHELSAAVEELDELFAGEDASTLLFLPLAHVFARVIQVGAVRQRVLPRLLPRYPEADRLTSSRSGRRSCSPCLACSRSSSTRPARTPLPTDAAGCSTVPR